MRNFHHLVFWTVCLFFVGSFSSAALADEPAPNSGVASPSAAALKEQGDQAMVDLRYAEALEFYTKSYEPDPNPALHYNRARAYEALARFSEALAEIRAFEARASAELKEKVPELDELISGLERRVSTLHITCDVRGARVLLAGVEIARTPISSVLRVNAGAAVLEIVADGYFPYRKSLTLPGGQTVTIEPRLTPRTTKGILMVTANVAGSEVFIDGKRVGTAPVQVELGKGSHSVRVLRDGFKTAETSAVVSPGKRTGLGVELDKEPTLFQRWWFWTGAAGVAAGGAVLVIALLTESAADHGDLQPGQIRAPLVASW